MTIEQRLSEINSLSERAQQIAVISEFLDQLESGAVRSATRDAAGNWQAVPWVKQGILTAFRIGALRDYGGGTLSFVDKDTVPPRRFSPDDAVRVVPGGSSVRRGSYLARGVVMMPPAYVNIGAYVDEATMIDSHALVGSCAQIGRRVHLSAAAQIGGVLEPIGNLPVIVEDDVIVGGNAGIYEGTIVRRRAVIGAGVVITASTPVYDVVRGEIYRRTEDSPLVIPEGAVVVPGSRPMKGSFAERHHLTVATPVIVKYRDEKTDAATALEQALR